MSRLARRLSLAATVAMIALVAAVSTAHAAPVLTQDFEGGLGGWTATGFWHVQDNPQTVAVKAPTINPNMVTIPGGTLPPAFSGVRAAWFGEASTGTFCGPAGLMSQTAKSGCTSNVASYAGQLTSPAFSLNGAISAILRFRTWFEIEGVDANEYDLMEVEYSTNGGASWTKVGKLNPANNLNGKHDQGYSNNGLLAEPGWKNYIVDLSPAIGSTNVKVRFAFDTRDANFNGFRGWLVDDVSVSTPFDAGQPVITDVSTCTGLQPSTLWVAHGANFVQGSKVVVDGVVNTKATMPAPDRIELNAGNAGAHTLQLISPNGTQSNLFQFAAGNCAQQGPGPSGAQKRPSAIQVFCNYIIASETDTCTATVADATGGGKIATGTVKFSSANGGAFMQGDTCQLVKNELSTVSSCTIQGFKPDKSKPLAVTGAYSGNDDLLPTNGVTQFLLAAPGNGAYLQTIKPFTAFGAPNGPQNSQLSVTVDNPVKGATVEGEASVSTNGEVCDAGLGGGGKASAAEVAAANALAAAAAQSKGKGKKGKKGVPNIPGLKKKPYKAKRINAVVAVKTKRNAKKGKIPLTLKFKTKKLNEMFGKKKTLNLVVRVSLKFKKGQPGVIWRLVKLKRDGKKGFKVVENKAKGKPKAKKSMLAPASSARALAAPAQAAPAQAGTTHKWEGFNDCSKLGVAAVFDQGDSQPPAVFFQWFGNMTCLDGSQVPFNPPSPGVRGTITSSESVTFSFAEFSNPGYTLSGSLFMYSAAVQGRYGAQYPDGRSCQAIAPEVLKQIS